MSSLSSSPTSLKINTTNNNLTIPVSESDITATTPTTPKMQNNNTETNDTSLITHSLSSLYPPRPVLSQLTSQQQASLQKLRELVQKYPYPEKNNDVGYFRLDDQTLLRFLFARDFDPQKAAYMLSTHLKLREKVHPHTLQLKDEGMEVTYGKNDSLSYWTYCGIVEIEGIKSTVEYVQVRHYNARHYSSTDMYVRNVLYMREIFTKLQATDGVENTIIIMDLDGWNLRDHAHPSTLSHIRQLVDVIQYSYPELLRCSFVLNNSIVFKWTWAIISQFIEPRPKSKIIWLDDTRDLLQWLPPSIVPKCIGGTLENFPNLSAIDEERRTRMGGGEVGGSGNNGM
jgi:hypothetical protein